MNLVRWNPFGELMSLRQAMDRLVEESFVRPGEVLNSFWDGGHSVSLDMYQTANDLVIKADLPGIKPEDIDITVTGDTLTIKGETKDEQEIKRENYLRQERRYGAFCRSVTLPFPVQTDKAEAIYKDGILTLTIAKAEEIRPKQIQLKVH
ncbi:MAG: Hsp20/alpha crystallin family protein [Chloroflexi bacterium]|nr:Hsp20/alpha crystallin family protein [Chloroflexota bacterium]